MPSMADLVVKKNDGTTDVTYIALVPSSGDRVAAQWRQTAASGIPSAGPAAQCTAKSSTNGKVRIVTVDFQYPITVTNSTTGVTSVVDMDRASLTFQVKSDYAQTWHDEAVAQFSNIVKTALLQSVMKAGYSPT